MNKLAAKRLNEQLKLFATFTNTIGVLSFVSGALVPYLSGKDEVPWAMFPAAILLHIIAQFALNWIQSEE